MPSSVSTSSRTRGAVSIRRALVPSGRFIGTWTAAVRTARIVSVSAVIDSPEGGPSRHSGVRQLSLVGSGFSRTRTGFLERQDLPYGAIHRCRDARPFAELRDAATEPRHLEAFARLEVVMH